MLHKIIYPGTFDPITNGHVNLIERAARIFNEVIVAVAANTHKTTLLSLDERVYLAKQSLAHIPNISVVGFSGLLVDFSQEQGVEIILRGVRAIADFEFERQLASMNQQLAPQLETLFLTPKETYAHISSTMVREIALLGGDISAFVTSPVVNAFAKYQLQRK